jgi:hypothetical protein
VSPYVSDIPQICTYICENDPVLNHPNSHLLEEWRREFGLVILITSTISQFISDGQVQIITPNNTNTCLTIKNENEFQSQINRKRARNESNPDGKC